MWSRADSFAAVVQQQREIENQRVVKSLENFTIGSQLRIVRLRQRIELIDAYQRMLVGCVSMQKFMLHQTGQLAEFGNVTTEKIDPMHHSQDASYFPFL